MTAKGLLNRIMAAKPVAEGKAQAGQRPALTGPVLVALSIILICAVAWAFFMGFMVGRGQSPQNEIHAMTGLLSPEEQAAQKKAAEENELLPPPAVLPAPSTQASVYQPPKGAAVQAWPNDEPDEPQDRKPKPAPSPAPKPAPDNRRYDFTFQTAALRSQADANKLKATLAAKKINATVRKSGKVYLVMVTLRGTRTDVASLQAKLKSAGLGKPLQVKKTPVNPGRNQRKNS